MILHWIQIYLVVICYVCAPVPVYSQAIPTCFEEAATKANLVCSNQDLRGIDKDVYTQISRLRKNLVSNVIKKQLKKSKTKEGRRG